MAMEPAIPWNSEVKVKRERDYEEYSGLEMENRSFSKKSFYGSKEDPGWKARLLSLTAPKDPFKLFYKQAHAFEWIDRTPIPERFALHVFAEEYACPRKPPKLPPSAAAPLTMPTLLAKPPREVSPGVSQQEKLDGNPDHLEVLQWLQENGYPWDDELPQHSASIENMTDTQGCEAATSEEPVLDANSPWSICPLSYPPADGSPPRSDPARKVVPERVTPPDPHVGHTSRADSPTSPDFSSDSPPPSVEESPAPTPASPASSRAVLFRGSRRYIVSTYDEFWRRYVTVALPDRHYYEVIREGEPSRLYFDIEYDKTLNPSSNGDEMVATLIGCVSERLAETHGISVPCTGFLDLESKYAKKFSRHVICPLAVFRDNIHCGLFVQSLVDHLSQRRELEVHINDLWINTDKGEHIFIDMGVYTKNRNFRLPFSSKLAKGIPLALSCANQYPAQTDKEVYHAGLVNNCEDRACLLDCSALVDLAASSRGSPRKTRFAGPKKCFSGRSRPEESSSSRYPDIDAFINSEIHPGYIRKCLYFADRALIIYEILGNRYCANIDRWHKSNHIMICVDLAKSVFYQKCHDPDCQGFRSEERVLPIGLGMAVGMT